MGTVHMSLLFPSASTHHLPHGRESLTNAESAIYHAPDGNCVDGMTPDDTLKHGLVGVGLKQREAI